jgi:AbrB family looped-hinge helix DNA binding protein
MAVSTVSQKGQITLPARMRKKLGMRPHDRIVIETVDDAIVIRRASDFLELAGFLGKALPREEEIRQVRKDIARHVRGAAK